MKNNEIKITKEELYRIYEEIEERTIARFVYKENVKSSSKIVDEIWERNGGKY